MPKIEEIFDKGPDQIRLRGMSWLEEAVSPGLIRGGTYLLAGEPGIGKTTLAIQVLGDLAMQGVKVLYVTTEQGLGETSCNANSRIGQWRTPQSHTRKLLFRRQH